MKKSLFSISAATLLAVTSIPAQALDDGLVYVAVEPCRIVDTRNAGGGITADTSRDFLASGSSSELAAQGGTADCENPRAGSEPLAISAYVLATGGSTKNGVLTAFPAGDPDPAPGAGSTLNFAKGQIIGNTTTITLCDPTGACPGDFAVLARNTDQNVVVDVQGYFYRASGSCSDDMVAVGSLCVDKFEASLVDSGNAPADGTTCDVSGSDCGGAIFAQSVASATPVSSISWYQAAQACANVGKRLPTTAEWQMAASGTVAGTGIAPDCNAPTSGGAVALTGASAACTSNTGAFDMVGNLWEFSADLDASQQSAGAATSTDDLLTVALGCSYDIGTCNDDPSTSSMFVLLNGPAAQNEQIGFRGVR